MATKLILIRHGETDWSRERRYCGITDIPLNNKGEQQALEAFKKLEKEEVDEIYSSNMKRPFQSAKIIFKNRQIQRLNAFREMNFGIFEGLTYKEVMHKFKDIYESWLDNPLKNIIPEGEGLRDLTKRVKIALEEILSCNKNKTIALVSHAGPIRVILCDALGLDLKEILNIPVNLASIHIIEFVNGKGKVLVQNG
ncbi:MAG: histidine phosphatase family protein [Candidatus Omnitrophota bacterium]|jgi:alpha-ribazole phosphatase|nr:histidine phosphatase family protein [Candidatus Omnitrophota bacterium]